MVSKSVKLNEGYQAILDSPFYMLENPSCVYLPGRTLPALHSLYCALPLPFEEHKGKMVKKNIVLSVMDGWWINAVGDQKIKKKRKILEMKNMKKKGFTLVELVIVIAVIAILAGVLIGTFSNVVSNANLSKELQSWKGIVDEAYVEYVADYHKAPEAVKVTGKAVEFVEKSYTNNEKTYYTTDAYVFEDVNDVVVLDEQYNVFLIMVKDGFQVVVGTKTVSGNTTTYNYGSTALNQLKKKVAGTEVPTI